jgi:hypothetical protein
MLEEHGTSTTVPHIVRGTRSITLRRTRHSVKLPQAAQASS